MQIWPEVTDAVSHHVRERHEQCSVRWSAVTTHTRPGRIEPYDAFVVMNALSIVVGLVALALQVIAVRGGWRPSRVLLLGAVLVVAMTAWALWHETFPATFATFAFGCVVAGPIAARART